MFQEEYRKAYDKINLEPAKLQELFSLTEQKNTKREWKYINLLRPMAVLSLSLCLFCMMTLPVLAERIPDGVSRDQAVCACFDGIYLT